MIWPRLKRFFLFLPARFSGYRLFKISKGLCRTYLWLWPHHPDILHQLGHIYSSQKQPENALPLLRLALKLGGNNPHIYADLGDVLLALGRTSAAEQAFRQFVDRQPNNPWGHIDLGNALAAQGKQESAATSFRQALAIAPDLAAAYHNLGHIFSQSGQIEQATDFYRRATKLTPEHAGALHGLGCSLTRLGQLSEAQSALVHSLDLDPCGVGAAFELAALGRSSQDDLTIKSLEKQIRHNNLSQSDAVMASFTLARIQVNAGHDDVAFMHYAQGNQLNRRTFHYEPTEDMLLFNRIVRVFCGALFSRMKDFGYRSEVPIFILGMPRSGTTLVEQILASHPQVHGGGELMEFFHLVENMESIFGRKEGFPEAVVDFEAQTCFDLGQAYTIGLQSLNPEASRVTDKLPHNFLFIGLIRLLLPNARIIHCRRDPVDTCLSCYMQLFAGWHPYAYDLAELGMYYRLYSQLMTHWHEVLPGQIFDIHYENLVAHPEREIRRLLAYCDLPWDPACLTFHQTVRPVKTASVVQVRQPLYQSSVGRWRRYEAYLGPLLNALGPLVNREFAAIAVDGKDT